MRKKEILAYIVLVISVCVIFFSIVRAAETPTIDHSQCQYPDRATNPPDGCDNSEPPYPACIGYGKDECEPVPLTKIDSAASPALTEQYQPISGGK